MKHIRSVYGDDVLSSALTSGEEYIGVVDPIAWCLCRDRLPRGPAMVVEPQSLEKDALDSLASSLPPGVRLVGVGGGLVMDATKYLALRDGAYVTPVLVPSISSSSAPFSDAITVREKGVPVGMVRRGASKTVMVDYKLIGSADPRLNRAGYADLLAHAVALTDWRLGAEMGLMAMNRRLFDQMQEHMEEALEIADEVALGSQTGILTLMRLFEASAALAASNPSVPLGAGSEHLLAWHLEGTTRRHFIHGEVVALGIIVADYLQTGAQAGLKDALDRAKVRYRLPELGISWDEFVEALQTVSNYNQSVRHYCSIFDRTIWSSDIFESLRQRVT